MVADAGRSACSGFVLPPPVAGCSGAGLLGLPARHEALAKEVRESRDRAVLLLDEISTLRNQVAARLKEVAARGAAIEERLRAAQGAPIWSADAVVRDDMRSSLALVGGKLTLVGSYLREHAFALLGIGLATMAASLLALAAMGIDLTKVTVLAGALGVGIGFGLQSVINNLLSGLILLVERPVTAGDVVQTGDTQGAVVGIGVRSTTVRKPAGAEVIVPNADLITKVVSNWTLSDSRCRIEIEVNLPSTVDPDHAIRLLQAAAAEVEEVAERPAPSAWLAGLRDGQRSYRLHAWIADYDTQTAVQSPLRVQIQRHFVRKAWRCPSTRHPLPLFSP